MRFWRERNEWEGFLLTEGRANLRGTPRKRDAPMTSNYLKPTLSGRKGTWGKIQLSKDLELVRGLWETVTPSSRPSLASVCCETSHRAGLLGVILLLSPPFQGHWWRGNRKRSMETSLTKDQSIIHFKQNYLNTIRGCSNFFHVIYQHLSIVFVMSILTHLLQQAHFGLMNQVSEIFSFFFCFF